MKREEGKKGEREGKKRETDRQKERKTADSISLKLCHLNLITPKIMRTYFNVDFDYTIFNN